MGFIAKDSGGAGAYKQVPAGVYVARCYSLIDLGTQVTNGQFGMKENHKIRIGWELFGEDDNGTALTVEVNGMTKPMTISKSYTMSLHEKASLRKELAAWRGKDFTAEEAQAFDVSKLLNAWCMVNVASVEHDGKTYANVVGVTPLPGVLRANKPDPVHEVVLFNLDEPDMVVFNSFHEKLQDVIRKAPEWGQGGSVVVEADDVF